ncbi:MAG: twin-arginine translocase subunit TatC, partial [Actinobacteria bacterium]|nr:twin-arginine translocase subunit TatC [Actinomycetota bacterium]
MTAVIDTARPDTEEPSGPGGRMSLVDHLTELRRRLVISAMAMAIGGVVAFFLYNHILNFLVHPYCSVNAKKSGCALFIQDPLEGFATRLKVAGYVGLFLASPVVLFQMWRFITPGLHPKEKKYAIPFVLSSIVLFVFGAVIAMLTFPQALHFLIAVGGPNLQTIFSPSKYLNLIVLMIVAFGVAFEFPVVLVFLEVAGVLSTARLK